MTDRWEILWTLAKQAPLTTMFVILMFLTFTCMVIVGVPWTLP